jgi:uncharacterized membrane protein required for colicin V production
MLWDALIALTIITLGIAGWNVGLINSWRGPFGIVAATIAARMFYVDFATFIVQQLKLPPQMAIALAFVLIWCVIDSIVEVLMLVILQFNRKTKPMFFERLFGAAFGLFRGFLIVLLPAVALQGPIKVPASAPDKSQLINPMDAGLETSVLLPVLNKTGAAFYPLLGPLVSNSNPPSFKPGYVE